MCTSHDSLAPETAPGNVDRRRFLKLSGAGLVGVFLASAPGAGRAFAQDSGNGSPDSGLMQEFREAAEEFEVPVSLLVAMGYVNTRWKMPPAGASEYEEGDLHGWGGYGIMALVKNPSSNTLGEASELTGISEEELKTDRRANIWGGAALLAESEGSRKPADLGEWRGAVSGGKGFGTLGEGADSFDAPSGVGGGEVYADQVFEALRKGAKGTTERGERISLEAGGADNG